MRRSARYAAVGLLALGLLVTTLERRAIASAWIEHSDFAAVQSVYFAPGIDAAQRHSFFAALASARVRVAKLYGPLRATPTIVVTDTETRARYADNATAVTHYWLRGATIVIGPKGQNVDVVAHELAHAELLTRVGYVRIEWCLPTWFDEGLATHFDERPFYTERAFTQRRQAGMRVPPLPQLASRAAFFAGTREQVRQHYALSRLTIDGWLAHKGAEAARHFVDTLRCDAALERELLAMLALVP
jgi:hypothetical protein